MSSPQMTTMFGLLDACACTAAGMATTATRVMRTNARKIGRLDFIDTSISPLVNVGRRRMKNLSSGLGLKDIVLWCNGETRDVAEAGTWCLRIGLHQSAPSGSPGGRERVFLGELQPTV